MYLTTCSFTPALYHARRIPWEACEDWNAW